MKRIQVIDLVRSLSIIAVMATHLAPSGINFSRANPFFEAWWIKIWGAGGYGVSMFFVISGFVITRLIALGPGGLFRPDFRDFYRRRAGRILPLLIATLAVGILFLSFTPVSSPGFEDCFRKPYARFSPSFWIAILTFTFNWYKIRYEHITPDFGLHWDVLWSLSIEEQFYFFYPLLLNKIRGARRLIIFLSGVVILGSLAYWTAHSIFPTRDRLGMNSFSGFGLIAMGCLLYLAVEKFKFFLTAHNIHCWGLVFLGTVLFLTAYGHPALPNEWGWKILGNQLLGIGVFFFLLGGLHLRFFESKYFAPFCWPGKLSYGAYLFHPAVLFLLWPFLSGLNGFAALFIYMAVTFLFAEMSFRFYEMPMNSWARKP